MCGRAYKVQIVRGCLIHFKTEAQKWTDSEYLQPKPGRESNFEAQCLVLILT